MIAVQFKAVFTVCICVINKLNCEMLTPSKVFYPGDILEKQ